jgi:enterochelin esterase family protein
MDIQIRSYTSTPLKQVRRLYVYLPPEYDSQPSRVFRCCICVTGAATMNRRERTGRGGVILENLIAAQRAVPALIVMTNGIPIVRGAAKQSGSHETVGDELMGDVIPLVEKNYGWCGIARAVRLRGFRWAEGRRSQSGENLDKFAWVGEFRRGS